MKISPFSFPSHRIQTFTATTEPVFGFPVSKPRKPPLRRDSHHFRRMPSSVIAGPLRQHFGRLRKSQLKDCWMAMSGNRRFAPGILWKQRVCRWHAKSQIAYCLLDSSKTIRSSGSIRWTYLSDKIGLSLPVQPRLNSTRGSRDFWPSLQPRENVCTTNATNARARLSRERSARSWAGSERQKHPFSVALWEIARLFMQRVTLFLLIRNKQICVQPAGPVWSQSSRRFLMTQRTTS